MSTQIAIELLEDIFSRLKGGSRKFYKTVKISHRGEMLWNRQNLSREGCRDSRSFETRVYRISL